jgi:hypothetical protein
LSHADERDRDFGRRLRREPIKSPRVWRPALRIDVFSDIDHGSMVTHTLPLAQAGQNVMRGRVAAAHPGNPHFHRTRH